MEGGKILVEIGDAIVEGFRSLFQVNPLTTFLVLAIIGLCFLVRNMLQYERKQNKEAMKIISKNTEIIKEMKEYIKTRSRP